MSFRRRTDDLRKGRAWSKPFIAAVSAAVTLFLFSLTVVFTFWAWRSDWERLSANFRFDADQRIRLIRDALERKEEALAALRRFFMSSERTTSAEFAYFASPWLGPSGFESLAWVVPVVTEIRTADAPLELRYLIPAEHAADDPSGHFSARLGGSLARAARDSELHPYPLRDFSSRLSLALAVSGSTDEYGPVETGFVIGTVSLRDLIASLVNASPSHDLPTTLWLLDETGGAEPLHSHAPLLDRNPDRSLGWPAQRPRLLHEQEFSVGAARFRLSVEASPGYLANRRPLGTLFPLAAGLLASLAAGLMIHRLLTTTRSAEARAQVNRDALDAFSNVALDLICTADTDGFFHHVNPQWSESLGYPLERLQQHRFLDFVHPDDLAATMIELTEVANKQRVRGFVNRYQHADGSYRWIEWRSSPGPGGLIYAAARDITDHMRIEAALRESIDQKEALLREVHHRVKNNLQIISSLLNLQSVQETDERLASQIADARGRVKSMAIIHEQLCESEHLSQIDFGRYAATLVSSILQNFSNARMNVTYAVEVIMLDMDKAVPCGLALNELVTNAVKYALRGNEYPSLHIGFHRSAPDCCSLLVADNGPGLPESVLRTWGSPEGGHLGLTIVQALARQLRGAANLLPGPGARIEVVFPLVAG